MPSTSGMKGDGFYDANSSGQRAAIEALLSWIADAAEQLVLPEPGRPLTIADYGSSEGSNALQAMRQAIVALRRRGVTQPIWSVFSDLSTNNFNQLFANLVRDHALPGAAEGVFSAAVGGSFYETLFPPATVQLAMSFNAVLWLDRLPAEPLEDFVVYLGARPHRPDVRVPPATAQAFAQQARGNLERFLRCRASELASGGRLLVAQPGSDHTYCTGAGLYDLVHDACLDLIGAGQLDRAAYARVTMPIYFRTIKEMLRARRRHDRSIAGQFCRRAGGNAGSCRAVRGRIRANPRHRGLRRALRRLCPGFYRAGLAPGLDAVHGPELVPAIFRRMKERLAADPARYAFRYLQVMMLLAKK